MFPFVRFLTSQGWGGDMPHKRAALVISVLASGCVLLAGCGGSSSSGSPPVSLPSGAVTVPSGPAAGSSGGFGTLTGNFCTDVRTMGNNIRPQANATGNSTTAKRYLRQARTYFSGLAAEAPKQVAGSLHVIAAQLQALAAAASSGNDSSLTKVSQKLQSLTTNGTTGNAFRNLIDYMVRKCS